MLKESHKKLVIMALPAIAMAVLAACGGGGGTSVGSLPQPQTPQPPASNPYTATVSAGANAVTAPPIPMGAASVSVRVPGGNGAATLQITGSDAAPTGVMAFSSTLSQTASVVGYVTITATSGAISFGHTPSFRFTVRNNLGQFYLAMLAPNGEAWSAPIAGPISALGYTVDLQGVSAQMSLTTGQTYAFALCQG